MRFNKSAIKCSNWTMSVQSPQQVNLETLDLIRTKLIIVCTRTAYRVFSSRLSFKISILSCIYVYMSHIPWLIHSERWFFMVMSKVHHYFWAYTDSKFSRYHRCHSNHRKNLQPPKCFFVEANEVHSWRWFM
jgi:hypothetical protein